MAALKDQVDKEMVKGTLSNRKWEKLILTLGIYNEDDRHYHFLLGKLHPKV